MFIKELSDEAFLAFAAQYGDLWHIDLYLSDHYERRFTEVHSISSKLYGYVSLEGEIRTDNQYILIYEPALDLYFVPIRLDLKFGMLTKHILHTNGSGTSSTLTEEDRLNVENGSATVIYANYKDGPGYSITFKREKWWS